MYISGMILGCLLLGQVPDMTFPVPSGGQKKSPATLGPIVAIDDTAGESAPSALKQTANGPAEGGRHGRRSDGFARRQRPDRPAVEPARRDLVDARSPPAVGGGPGILAAGPGGGHVPLLPGSCARDGTRQTEFQRTCRIAAGADVGNGDGRPIGVGGGRRPVRIGAAGANVARCAPAFAGRSPARRSLSDLLPRVVRGQNRA